MIDKSCVQPPDTSRSMYAYSSPAVWWTEWIHMLRHARIFYCRGKNYDKLFLFHYSPPFIHQDKSQPFNPRHHFQFIHSLSHHFPSFLLPSLTPFLPFLLILFLLLFPSALGESALAFLLRPLSLLPSVLYVCLCHHLCVRNQMKLLLSADTRTCTLCHAPAEEFTSHLLPHSPLPPQILTCHHCSSCC